MAESLYGYVVKLGLDDTGNHAYKVKRVDVAQENRMQQRVNRFTNIHGNRKAAMDEAKRLNGILAEYKAMAG